MGIGLFFVGAALLLVLLYGARRFAAKQKQLYAPHLATVLEAVPTAEREGHLVRFQIHVEIAGHRARRETVEQWMDPERLPHAGQVVRVILQNGALVLTGFAEEPSGKDPVASRGEHPGVPVAAEGHGGGLLKAVALTAELRSRGVLHVATVTDIRSAGAGQTRLMLDIDAIGAPARRVVLQQLLAVDAYSTGERAYLLVEPDDANAMHVLVPSSIGGQRLPREMNRLDPFVLGPQLLHRGARARGTVLSAVPVPLDPSYEVRGFTRFRLRFRIEPEGGGAPFEAEQVITLTRPEKIAAMATPGATVPLRFDTANPQTFATDSLAMGYGDPYAEAVGLFREQLSRLGAA